MPNTPRVTAIIAFILKHQDGQSEAAEANLGLLPEPKRRRRPWGRWRHQRDNLGRPQNILLDKFKLCGIF